jgi:cyclophilin family peptidyl-prolyl cis-trans isomerase
VHPFRRARLESLEPRWVLSAPTLAPIADVTLAAGAPLHIVLDGYDADGDALDFTIESTGDDLATFVPEGNQSIRITVAEFGDMVFELFEQRAPTTTARILELVGSDFYDDIIFHRVANYADGSPFVIQTGDPDGDGTGGSGIQFDDEFHPDLMHTRTGLLSMANSGDDTSDSQFFVTGGTTRHLDFNHSIFGQLTAGDDVRAAIQGVETDDASQPLTDVVIESIEAFYDVENGVLMLSAPEGMTGETDVTVTVSDGQGGTAAQTFHVTIVADADASANANPYLLPIDDVYTTADTPVSFTIPALDVEDDALHFDGIVSPVVDGLSLEVNSTTGVATVTPSNGLAGVYSIIVGVRAADAGAWDTQAVPVFISPAVPSGIVLLAGSDTGTSDSDSLTNLNNLGQSISFRVSGVLSGAEVTLFADGVQIGQATATTDSVVIITDGVTELTDGVHSITAVQTLRNQQVDVGNRDGSVDLASEVSAALEVTVDTAGPQITSAGVLEAAEGAAYLYDVQTNDELDGLEVVYRMQTSPAGMVVDMHSGVITWTPSVGQAPTQSVVVIASDQAGNETEQSFDIQINAAPQIDPIADQFVAEQTELVFQVTAQDDDLPLVFSLGDNVPAGATIDADTGVFSWTPTEAQGPGIHAVAIHVTDALGASSHQTVRIGIGEVNLPPEIDPIAHHQWVDEDELLELTVTATDPDLPAPDGFVFSLGANAPNGATIDPTTGQFRWRPDETHGDRHFEIVVRATDTDGAFGERTFTVRVAEINQPPVFAAIGARLAMPGKQLRLNVTAADPDLPANAVTYSLEPGAPQNAAVDPVTGLLTWDVPEDHPWETVRMTVRATEAWRELFDGGQLGLSSTMTLRIVVADPRPMLFDQAVASAAKSMEPAEIAATQLALDRFAIEPAGSGSSTSGFAPFFLLAREASPWVGQGDTLGFQIASDMGGGGLAQLPAADQTPEQPIEKSDKLNMPILPGQKNPRSDKQSGRTEPEITDTALEQLLEEDALLEGGQPDEGQFDEGQAV